MKTILVLSLTLLNLISLGQDNAKKIKKIKSVEQANTFIKENPALEGDMLEFNSGTDSSELSKRVFSSNPTPFILKNNTYKLVETRPAFLLRVNYIYLDASKLSMHQIDSTRKVIIDKYKKGEPFPALAKQYTMDGNPNCDLGWVQEDLLDKEFTTEFKKHKKGEVFTINVLGKMWYYVALKPVDDRKVKIYSVLRIKNSN